MRYSNTMRDIILLAHNLRSTHNVGSLLRTAEGLGVQKVMLTGYTPYPSGDSDSRLPHLSLKLHRAIQKTALGAETTQPWERHEDITAVVTSLREQGWTLAALEQSPDSTPLPSYKAPQKLVLIVGREVEGIEPEILQMTDVILEIPMFGQKESFNVTQSAAMALYHCRFC